MWKSKTIWTMKLSTFRMGQITKYNKTNYYWEILESTLDLGFGDFDHITEIAGGHTDSL